TLSLRMVDSADTRARVFDDCCVRGSSDGALVVWMTPPVRFAERLVAERFPVVLLNAQDPRMWSVGVDHQAAAKQAAAYCLGLGHRRLALVDRLTDPFDAASPALCGRGFHEALTQAQVEVPADYERLADIT